MIGALGARRSKSKVDCMNGHPDPSGKSNVTESISTEERTYQFVAKIPSRTQSQF